MKILFSILDLVFFCFTSVSVKASVSPAEVTSDTTITTIEVKPLTGDCYQALQDAINYYINTGMTIKLIPGTYHISKPLVIAKIVSGQYKQSSIYITGTMNAKNAVAGSTAIIVPMFNDAPAIAIQQGKNVRISNLSILGQFDLPGKLNQIQVDTMLFSQWDDGYCRQNLTSPYAGIAIDFASDPTYYDGKRYQMYPSLKSYYMSGMSRAGSTQIVIDGVSIRNFVVGCIITPSCQQNGDIIHIYHSQIDGCKVAYAMCQAQSKQCEVKDLEVWSPCHTIFDNVTYGYRHGDGAGSPMVDGVNVAGAIHQIFNMATYAFNGVFRNIYAEGIFKLGYVGGNAGARLDDCTFDFSSNVQGLPQPDFYMYCNNVIHTNCTY